MLDLREGLFQPQFLQKIAFLLWHRIRMYQPDRLGGVTMSADQLTIALIFEAMREGYQVEGFSIRKMPKAYGLRKTIEGPEIRRGERVVIVDDLLSSGSTLTHATSTLRSNGATIAAAAVVVDFQRGGTQALKDQGVPTVALTTLADLGITRLRNGTTAKHVWKFGVLNVGTYTAPQCSPVLIRNKIVVGADLGFVVALTTDGRELWRVSTEEHQKGVRGRVRATDRHIYFGAHDGNFYCVNDDGVLHWKAKLGDSISVPAEYNEKQDLLYVPLNFSDGHGECLALDAPTGATRWRFPLASFAHAWPTLAEGDSLVIVASNGGGVLAVECSTGQVRWRYDIRTPVKGRIVSNGSFCYFGAFDGNIYALETKSGKEVWRRRLGDWLLCIPAITKDRLFVGGPAHVCSLDIENGAIVWVQATEGRVAGVAISADGSNCVCGSESGLVLGLNALNGNELWSYSLGSPIRAVPLLNEHRCILPAYDGFLHCLSFDATPAGLKQCQDSPLGNHL